MKFEELFREKYRSALLAAREGDAEGTLVGLTATRDLLERQYNANNGDPRIVKLHLSIWRDRFAMYVRILQDCGLQDARLSALFGFVAPAVPVKPKTPDTTIVGKDGEDFGGLIVEPEKPAGTDPSGNTPSTDPQGKDSSGGDREPEGEKPLTEPIPVTEEKPPVVPEPSGEASFEPQSLKDFIGQAETVAKLRKAINMARNKGQKYLDNILLLGAPGLGKTTLMKLIAKELGVRFEFFDCAQFRDRKTAIPALQNFFLRVAREREPVVIAMDEIHMLNEELQSCLLTLLNDRMFVTAPDKEGKNVCVRIDNFTFIGATTDEHELLPTIKNRCLNLTFRLEDYTPAELAAIYRQKFAAIGVEVSPEAIDLCVPRSRGAIRYVNAIVKDLDWMRYDDEGRLVTKVVDLELAKKYFASKGIDGMGLTKKDRDILLAIMNATRNAMSADSIANTVGIDVRNYKTEYEPFLMKQGLINVGSAGRSLTQKGWRYLRDAGLIPKEMTLPETSVLDPVTPPEEQPDATKPEDGSSKEPPAPPEAPAEQPKEEKPEQVAPPEETKKEPIQGEPPAAPEEPKQEVPAQEVPVQEVPQEPAPVSEVPAEQPKEEAPQAPTAPETPQEAPQEVPAEEPAEEVSVVRISDEDKKDDGDDGASGSVLDEKPIDDEYRSVLDETPIDPEDPTTPPDGGAN